jgi:hypothetical protein
MAKKKTAKKKTAKKSAKRSAKKKGAKKTSTKKSIKSSKRKAAKRSPKKKASGGRELIAPRGDKRFVRRDDQGQFSESDDVSRSLSSDRPRNAKRTVKAGQGDKGDRKSS